MHWNQGIEIYTEVTAPCSNINKRRKHHEQLTQTCPINLVVNLRNRPHTKKNRNTPRG